MGKKNTAEVVEISEDDVETVEVAEVADAPKTKKKCNGITQEAKITIKVDSNPKRSGSASYDRFEGYLTETPPATVKDALENGLIMGDIHYDFIHGSIDVEGATIEEYTPSARGPRDASAASADDEEVETDEDGEDNF